MKNSDTSLVIGLPRALLYHRYAVLWHTFFEQLGVQTIVSEPTTKGTLDQGILRTIDEACLSTKIYMGHVAQLIGKCDYILIPRISNLGLLHVMCTKFEALYDMTRNIFRDTNQKFISYNVDEKQKLSEDKAFIKLGMELGFKKGAVVKAYKKAKKAELDFHKSQEKKQEKLLQSDKTKILLAGHSYLLDDDYIGKPLLKMLEAMDAVAIRADYFDTKTSVELSHKISPTLKWEMNREIVGGIYKAKDKVDGIIQVSAFPCGPDSMVNEIVIRQNYKIPILTLIMDVQDGAAGVETRIESFLDIIRFKKGKL